MRRSTDARGFTLLEIAIAMGVLGLAVVSALQVFGSAMQLARSAARKSEAVVHARAKMDEVLWLPTLGRRDAGQGEVGDGYQWVREIAPAGPEDGVPDDDLAVDQVDLRLLVIRVTVRWREPSGDKGYQLQTMRLVPNDDED